MRPSEAQMSLFLTNLPDEMASLQPDDDHGAGLSTISAPQLVGAAPQPSRAGGARGAGLRERLTAIDWNFRLSDDSGTIHAIHPYPAKFISAIPRELIRQLGVRPGSVVFDPFCGCGTTLAVAQEMGVASVGVDLNPIACLVSKVKTSPLPRGLLAVASATVAAAAAPRNRVPPAVPNVAHWFDESVQRAITALVDEIGRHDDLHLREHLQLALSSILVRVSRQESDTRYAAVEKNVSFSLVLEQFLQACSRLQRLKSAHDTDAQVTILQSDILKVKPEQIAQPVSLVITSPPYPNAYEYWLYHKYRMWWLGHDPIAVKKREIGARAHYFKKNHATYAQFADQMRTVLRLIHQVLSPNGFACFVVGRSRIHGVDFDNADTIARLATQEHFALVARLPRIIAPTRKSFNLSHARIQTEEIVVLQKGRA